MAVKKAVMVPVQVFPTVGEASMVEYEEKGIPQRRSVPKAEIVETADGLKVPKSVLDAGLPFGVSWADYITKVPKAEEIECALKQAGIWTLDQLGDHPHEAYMAFLLTAEMSVAALRTAVALEKK